MPGALDLRDSLSYLAETLQTISLGLKKLGISKIQHELANISFLFYLNSAALTWPCRTTKVPMRLLEQSFGLICLKLS